jgi:hypothetical protein
MSETAHKLIVRVGDCGGRLWTMDGTLRYSGPRLPADLLAELKAHREDLLAYMAAPPREHCRGGCGKLLPAGQMCIPCAICSVAEWTAKQGGCKR